MRLVFSQILVILLYVAVGFGAGKARLILPEQRKYLSGLCSNLILPFTILSAASQSVDGRDMAALLATVAVIAMLAAGLHFPDPVQTVLSGVGSMVTPLSLIIIGVMLSESRIVETLREKRSYLIALLRNLGIPLIALPALKLLPMSADARLCVLVYLACPCATLTSIYAIKCDTEPEFAAHTVLLSTLLFAATLPAIIAVGQAFL